MGLRDIGATLPPGFRFYPSDEELVCHYLYNKIRNEEAVKGTLVEVDLHTCEPWQLPEVAKLNSDEWYFFSFRDRKYATGYRTNRATVSGYWKATGKDRTVHDPITQAIVGMRKTLVFYRNRAPNGIKTAWIMHEFRLDNPNMPPKEDWVLCRVFHKSKGESGDKLSRADSAFETTAGVSVTSTNLASSSPNDQQTMPFAYHDQICSSTQTSILKNHKPATTNTNTILNLAVVNPNFLHFAQDPTHLPHNEMNSMCDDEYGFLFDMSFQDSSLGTDGVMTPSLEEMRFEDDKTLLLY